MVESKTLSEFHIRSVSGISAMLHPVPYPTMHDHTYYEVHIQTSGSIKHCFIDNTFDVINKGDIILIAPHLSHCYKPIHNIAGEYINIPVKSSLFYDIVRFLDIAAIHTFLDSKTAFLKTNISDNEIDKLYDTFSKITPSVKQRAEPTVEYKFLLIDALHYFAKSNSDPTKPYPKWLNEFLLKLQNIEIFLLPFEQIIFHSGYSHSYLCSQFKKYTGHTLQNYVIALKIQYSAQLLLYTDDSLAFISNELGYANQGHFSSVFRKHFFTSPLNYRKQNKLKPTPDN